MEAIQAIFSTIPKGYVLIHKDLRAEVIPSKHLDRLLGHFNKQKTDLLEIFPFKKSQKDMFIPTLEQYFENIMPLSVTLSLFPKKVQVSAKIVGLTYYPILNDKKEPQSLLVEVCDCTGEEAKRQLEQIHKERNEMLLKILKEKESFLHFLKDTEQELKKLAQGAKEDEGKRILHTIKGNSSSFGLIEIAEKIHDIETMLPEEIELEGPETFFFNSSHEISGLLDAFLIDHFSVLAINRRDVASSGFHISERELAEIERQLAYLNASEIKEKITHGIKNIKTKPAHIFISHFEANIQRVAKILNKEIQFKAEGAQIKVAPQSVGAVLRELIHLIRNSCDHGIETPEIREQAGKTRYGNIFLFIRELGDGMLEITLEDDGRGIQIDKLVAASIQKGVITSEIAAKMSAEEKINLIFSDGVSTAEKISQISGRGVGMSSLKSQIESNGGKIEVQTKKEKGSIFKITMPRLQVNSVNFSAAHMFEEDDENKLVWSDALKINIDEMDAQHEKIVNYISQLDESHKRFLKGENISTEEVGSYLQELASYTVFHFNEEEKLMDSYSYPDFKAHVKLHEKLLSQLKECAESFQTNGLDALPKILSFVSNWLKSHILGNDRKYASFINNQSIKWKENLSVGVEEMDEEHRNLIAYINEFKMLHMEASEGHLTDFKPIYGVIKKITDYTVNHFSNEEALMEKHGYPHIDEHKRIHQKLILQVQNFIKRFQEDPIKTMPIFSSFLSRWLLQHIQGTDKKYGAYIHQKSNPS